MSQRPQYDYDDEERDRSGREYEGGERYGWGYGGRQEDMGRPEFERGYAERGFSEGRSGQRGFGERGFIAGRYGQQYNGGEYGSRYGPQGSQGYGTSPGYGGQQGTALRGGAYTGMSTGRYTGKGPKGYQRSDERIREDVCELLTQHGAIDASDIEVKVAHAEVTLTGSVDDRRTKRMVEDALDHVSGVKDVHNQLKIKERGGQGDWDTGSGAAEMNTTGSTGKSRIR
jgi:hypothetical protein